MIIRVFIRHPGTGGLGGGGWGGASRESARDKGCERIKSGKRAGESEGRGVSREGD
jgi:hypothetical protein